MLKTQEQPFHDMPAIEQAPMVEHVVKTTRRIQPARSPIFLPTIISYIFSVLAGGAIAYLINTVFGSPYNQGLIQFESSLWRIGIPLSLITAFLLGIFLPVLFAKSRRGLIILITLLLQFITLTILVVAGLYQLSGF